MFWCDRSDFSIPTADVGIVTSCDLCMTSRDLCVSSVDGGHRAIIFSRLGGIQSNIYTEGLHFRIPWFQYPIVYDIRYGHSLGWESAKSAGENVFCIEYRDVKRFPFLVSCCPSRPQHGVPILASLD